MVFHRNGDFGGTAANSCNGTYRKYYQSGYPVGANMGFNCCSSTDSTAITDNTIFYMPNDSEYSNPFTPMMDYPALSPFYFYPPYPVTPKYSATVRPHGDLDAITTTYNAPNPSAVNAYTGSVIPSPGGPGYSFQQGLYGIPPNNNGNNCLKNNMP